MRSSGLILSQRDTPTLVPAVMDPPWWVGSSPERGIGSKADIAVERKARQAAGRRALIFSRQWSSVRGGWSAAMRAITPSSRCCWAGSGPSRWR